MRIKKFFFALAIFMVSSLSAQAQLPLPPLTHPLKARFLMMTFPKSGTHLVRKLLYIVGCELGHPEANQYTWDHFFSNHKEYWPGGINPFFAAICQNKRSIVVIRDLRDVAVSCAYWHTKMVNETSNRGYLNYIPLEVLNEWNAMTMEEKVTRYIKGDFYPEYKTFGAFMMDHFKNMEAFLSIMKSPLIIRYEDIVGVNGGGTLEAQVEAICQVAELIGVHLSGDEIDYICENLFGCREQDESMEYMQTYRKGGIGGWKNVFTSEQISLFKETYNGFLIKYGYEENDQW